MGFNPGGSGGLASASDVAFNSPQDNQVLTYDSPSAKWQNQEATGSSVGGLLGVAVVTVASSNESASVKATADYVCDGTADEVQINAALASVGSESVTGAAKGANGGMVILVGRKFTISGPVLLQSQTELVGAYGKSGTWIYCAGSYAPGSAGGIIELATLNTQYTVVRDVGLHGNSVNVCGIRHEMGVGQEYDGYHVAKDIYIWNVGSHGVYALNQLGGRLRGNMYSDMRIINAGGYGVYSKCPDSFYQLIDVGSAGSNIGGAAGHGFYCGHSNNRYVNCKAWFSDGTGFHIAGGRDNMLSGCESQDNELHGYYVSSARSSLSSCVADSNSHTGSGVSGNGDGFHVIGEGTNIHGTATDKNESNRGRQQRYGVNIIGTPRVIINVSTFGNATASRNGAGHATSVLNIVDSPT